jgi:hypothetical protein
MLTLYKDACHSPIDWFDFRIPYIVDDNLKEEMQCYLEQIAMYACYLGGDDQMGLKELVEFDLGMSMNDYNPQEAYDFAYVSLCDAVCDYNASSETKLKVVVDDIKTALLRNDWWTVYKVV